jgi:hypothetical protein
MKSRISEPDPYAYITDSKSAIEEYYKLKAQLGLTLNERLALMFGQNKTTDIIQTIRSYILDTGTSVRVLADKLNISYVALHNLLTGKSKQPYGKTETAIKEFLRGLNNEENNEIYDK